MAKTVPTKSTIETVNHRAAAVDIGSRMHMAAVNPDTAEVPVRAFGTFTHDLHDLAAWFKSHGVTSVAMESTGVYWIPAYEILEQHGFEVILVNARYAKNVPGRKTDVSDASWLRQLHSYGLLRGSFRPTAQIATLRAYMRQRERLVEYAAAHIQHMQKALMEMNFQLHHVVSDITGVTGLRIIRAIVAGERDLDVLASCRDVRCHASVETIKAALNGNDRPEHIFALTQSLDLYDFYQAKMLECDRNLEAVLDTLATDQGHNPRDLPRVRTKTKQVGTPSFDVRTALFGILGLDLTQIHGLGPSPALSWSQSAEPICERGQVLNTSRLGFAWPRAIRSRAARCCRHAQGVRPAARQPCCDWPLSQSAAVIPHLVHSIAASRRGQANPKR